MAENESAEDLINNIDFEQLKSQKKALNKVINEVINKELATELLGILNLVDSIQDYAVDKLGKKENEVFNLTQD